MRRGEIWTIQPLNHPKPRPALIVSVDPWNSSAPDVVLVPLTTRPGPSRPPVQHPQLKRASYAKCGAISAIPKEHLKQRLGILSDQAMSQVIVELRRVLGI
ncbi:MAG: type II toxin-antitoxin system PemK/MazF family toxin [Gemmatimonadetes bacterium]|nr:type II toxin-antitoxin system PemK/MazF family toxin [Gemmatimonadota bacterium]